MRSGPPLGTGWELKRQQARLIETLSISLRHIMGGPSSQLTVTGLGGMAGVGGNSYCQESFNGCSCSDLLISSANYELSLMPRIAHEMPERPADAATCMDMGEGTSAEDGTPVLCTRSRRSF